MSGPVLGDDVTSVRTVTEPTERALEPGLEEGRGPVPGGSSSTRGVGRGPPCPRTTYVLSKFPESVDGTK